MDAQKKQIKKRMDQLAIRLDEKISDYDLDSLIKEIEVLMKILQSFEHMVNGRLYLEDKGDMQGANCMVIKCIYDSFIKVIDLIQKDTLKAGTLPIFTIIATVHLQFLYFVEKNRSILGLQLDTKSFNQCFKNDFKKTTEEYVSYIQKTYQIGIQKFVKKMQDIVKFEIGNYNLDDQENLSEMRKYYKKIFVHEATALSLTAKRKVVNLAIAINEYENLMFEKSIYYDETWGNKAFLQVIKLKTQKHFRL
ncbi:insecticidal delta-endotoxin Cry8Ea1 family protein [Bacillus cereus]|uniref:insecticidal delta-endotoxin Cry8Ea1 family protein n=2 Tax=Bacillus cereus TaxID=1396 RepID=UPI001116F2C5|nr:insecticidal delta-endotoxin Cry8Ea1 family protein [Bacillus cereus]